MSDTNGSNPYGDPIEPGAPNNPDPYGGAPQSNPYGSPQPSAPMPPPSPYAAPPTPPTNPYAAPPANPYGGSPNPYGQPGGPKKTDGMSIGALVASVIGLCTCIGAPIGIILGFIGMSRTKDGRANGRGLAISGVVVGFIGVAVWIIGVIALVVVGLNIVVTPSNAKVGQCVNLDESDGNKISMVKQPCADDHDAQIIGVGTVTSENLARASRAAFCMELVSTENEAKLAPHRADLQVASVTESPDNMLVGDHVVCYVKATTGKLSEDLLD